MSNTKTRHDRFLAASVILWSQSVRFMALLAMTSVLGLPASRFVYAGEFRFVVEDLPDNSAAWLPSEVIIHTETELDGGLIFLLVNPTARTHVFLVEGLYEEKAGADSARSKIPLRVTVAPEETVRTVVDTERFKNTPEEGETETFHFYCPLHRSDDGSSGTISLIHRGGTIRMMQ